jgi:hypothetical protein
MTRRSAAPESVQHALSLRTAMLGLLADCEPTVAEREAMRRAPEDAWRLLLASECCALPVGARLRERAILPSLPAATQRRIAAAELSELQRVLAARSTLEALDGACATLGIAPIVLKGGAIAAERRKAPLDLGDVDVLLDEREAATLWAQLRLLGWRRESRGSMPETPVRVDANHFEALLPPGEGLALEVHTQLDYQQNADGDAAPQTRSLEGRQALRRLVGQSAFLTALRHSVVKHPHRRGHLRDLAMLSDALGECDEQLDRIEQGFDGDPMAPELIAMCAQARAMAERRPIVDDDRTRSFVAWKYATYAESKGILGRLPGWSGLHHLPLEREPTRRSELARQLRYAVGPVPHTSPFAALGERAENGTGKRRRTLGARGVARVLRVSYRLTLLALLVLTSRHIRRRFTAMSRA